MPEQIQQQPLPRYNLPQQSLPAGIDVAAGTPPNPLAGLQQGGVQGFQLGLQARQQAALEQQRNIELMQQQAVAQQAKRENDLKALDSLSAQYDRLAKNHPDTAFEFYQTKMAPFYSSVLKDHGIDADFQTDAKPDHETADSVGRIHDAVTGLADGTIQMPEFQKIMSREQSGHNVGDYLKSKIDEAQKSADSIKDYNNHIDTLEQNYSNDISAMKSRSGTYGTQDGKVALAAHLRTLINQGYNPKTGDYFIPPSNYHELVMGAANLAANGGQSSEEDRKQLESMTLAGKLNQAVQQVTGKPQPANTQAIIKNLIDSIDRQGLTAQQLRDQELNQVKPSADLPQAKAARVYGNGRGADFKEYLPGGQYGPKQAVNSPEAYLKSVGAKVTPKNLEWAKSKMGSN